MKKIFILLISIGMISFSCDTPDSSPVVIGFSVANGAESTDIYAGPDDIANIWAEYIDAHNNRDFESIKSLNADNFSAFGPVGDVVEGTEAHIEFLTEWFETNNPKWNLLWAISNTGQTPEGESLDFVTAGHEVKLSLDGDEVTVYQVIDANISDGKIVNFNVFQQERGQSSSD
tara:strand:- start:29 stop:550 length:522 start_codon:yes stop_codon:yes gene_type:complete